MARINKSKVESIEKDVSICSLCKGIDESGALCLDDKDIGLSYRYPENVPIEILFIAESPPKPGNGFFYDESYIDLPFRKKLFKLINASGLGWVETLRDFNNKGYYLADAINCRWDKTKKNYLSVKVFKNCSKYIARQIEKFKPRFIVAMGNTAQKSLTYPKVTKAIETIKIPKGNIIKISLILVASTETDEQRIAKLKSIADLKNLTH